jgi:DNA segregation ATPase FtsK/SpoIIIE, S-DNA-T family
MRLNPSRAPDTWLARLMPPSVQVLLRDRMLEMLGLLALGLAAVLLLALVTHDLTDPSLNVASTRAAPNNWIGRPGAMVSDLLVQVLGWAGYVLVLVPLVWGVRLLQHSGLQRPGLRLLLLLLGVCCLAGAFGGLHGTGPSDIENPGGLIGALTVQTLTQNLPRSWHVVGLFLLGAIGASLLVGALGMRWRDWRRAARLSAGAGGTVGGMVGHGAGMAFTALRKSLSAPTPNPIDLPEPEDEAAPTLRAVPIGSRARDVADLDRKARTAKPVREKRAPQVNTPETEATDDPPFERDADHDAGDHQVEIVAAPTAHDVRVGKRVDPQPAKAAAERNTVAIPDITEAGGAYEFPPLSMLAQPDPLQRDSGQSPEALRRSAGELEIVLGDFGVRGEIVEVNPGPVVTLFELQPAPGTKSSRVIGLSDDIARSMSAMAVRVAVVPGRNVIGIELPNKKREIVLFRELLETRDFESTKAKLPLALGKDIGGGAVIADLAKMPHLLVAGTTGSGKSVGINGMIMSLLYRLPPERCRFIMIDPKMLELSVYNGIPHLLTPVVTDPSKAVVALKWAVREMEDRYRLMSTLNVRNIDGYNARIREALAKNETLSRRVQTGFDPDTGKPVFEDQPFDLVELPYIVVVVDEMADLMLVAGKDIEGCIQRLAQMARAAGLHLIMATQRPSVDVITGTIKANFPTRISYAVTSKIDSRTILGEQGAEQLLGQGDMLFMAPGGRITRVHGAFLADEEVETIVAHLKAQGEPIYVDAVTEDDEDLSRGGDDEPVGERDGSNELYDRAVAIVARERKASTSFIQRHLQIGYNRAARLIERMEKEGVISRANHVGKREVLLPDHGDY